ncbi:hypothetical protein E3E34_11190, partial [Thermococcus sp. GR4]|nr:hypothetical protein [Thermococcus sp. GR4]
MVGTKWGAFALVLLLLGSVVPLIIAEDNATASDATLLDNSTRETVIAEQLINQLQRLSKFAEDKIEPIKDKLPENSGILANYETAEEYKGRAISEYEAGAYYNSILDSLTAMHYYKLALSRLQEAADRVQDLRERIRIETERM